MKKLHMVFLLILGILLLNFFSDSAILKETQQVFNKEVDLVAGRSQDINVLSGRVLLWRSFMNEWSRLSIFEKLLGTGIGAKGYHNEFIRILFSGGILFLSVSVLIMVIFLIRININYWKDKKFIHFIALIALVYFFIESLGTWCGMYPSLVTIVWGLVGLSVNNKFSWEKEIEPRAERTKT